MRPTQAQSRASSTLDRHVAVTAGPGSGKTRVLVSRYLAILERTDARIENVVAITFTNKAASEMRERLRRELHARVDATRRTSAEPVWRDRKRRLEGAVITTIHGFCSRLLREHPVEAVVDPQFSILDDYTASVMVDASAHAAVTDLIDREDELGAHLVAAYGRATLVQHLLRVYNSLRGLGVAIDDAEARTLEATLGPDAVAARVADVDRLVERGREIVDRDVSRASRANASARVEQFAGAWAASRDALLAPPALDATEAFLAALGDAQAAIPNKRIAEPLRPWIDDVRAVVGERSDKAPHGALRLAYFDACSRPFVPLIFSTLRGLDALYGMEKRAAAALDYEDLQLRARDLLRDHADVARRTRARYRYFLVDEFQDTNSLQREIVDLLTLGEPRANLFIVGDRKQSIYGFRGAEVDVFARAIAAVEADGGEAVALDVNFRSDARLVAFFNEFFARLMRHDGLEPLEEAEALGYVPYEPGVAHRPAADGGPAVEALLDLPSKDDEEPDDAAETERARDREARRLAARIADLVEQGEPVVRAAGDTGAEPALRAARYGDVAILLRAMSEVKTYERALRSAGVPYYVVAGKGFYDRPEVADLLALLEFVDNRTDELALAAVLRSPLFGVSDDTLLALRIDRFGDGAARPRRHRPAHQPLYEAVLAHSAAAFIADEQHEALEEAAATLSLLLELRNRVSISELLAVAIRRTDYDVVAAAAVDGAQRLSNLDKLLRVARTFERGAMRLLRDFVEYVREFRRLEGREAEAYLRSDEDAVAILTVHKAKGLEFPVVCLPDLQRTLDAARPDVLFERGSGLAFRVPDGRGGLATTALYDRIAGQKARRERFESIRTLYVAATRAEDLLVLSGATDRAIAAADGPPTSGPTWLHWLVSVLASAGDVFEPHQRVLELGSAAVRVIGPRIAIVPVRREPVEVVAAAAPAETGDAFGAVETVRRRLDPISPAEGRSARRYAATSLQSYVNCQRQFYYSRLLRLPVAPDAAGSRDLSERPEGGAILPAGLRGVVIHRFCETYVDGDDLEIQLRRALDDVRAARGDAYADVFTSLDPEAACRALLRYARHYVASPMRRRVDERLAAGVRLPDGQHEFVRSELPFTLRVAEGYVHGTIDKLLLTPLPSGRVRATIVDFKTAPLPNGDGRGYAEAAESAASAHLLQMQIYALAARALVPRVGQVEAALHFLHPAPHVEYYFPAEAVAEARASRALSGAMTEIARGGFDPVMFEARPGTRCRSCAFSAICPEGTRHLSG
jgi:ATP-dependent helicase/nuclease subunit A